MVLYESSKQCSHLNSTMSNKFHSPEQIKYDPGIFHGLLASRQIPRGLESFETSEKWKTTRKLILLRYAPS